MEVVQYILGDFWHFIIILGVMFDGIECIIRAIKNK